MGSSNEIPCCSFSFDPSFAPLAGIRQRRSCQIVYGAHPTNPPALADRVPIDLEHVTTRATAWTFPAIEEESLRSRSDSGMENNQVEGNITTGNGYTRGLP